MASDLERRLKRRFRDFLSRQETDPQARAIRSSIGAVLDQIVERGWKTYVVGGTLRDVMLAPPSAFPRDIDLIVVGPSQDAMENAFSDLITRKTRFGGLHLVRPFDCGVITRVSGEVLFDIWRLEDTWGIRDQDLPPTIENFVRTPFLNIDSVAIEVCSPEAQRKRGHQKVAECGFFRALSTHTLEINYEPNPYPLVCIVRTLIMAAKLKFSLAPSLASFVLDYSRWGSIEDLVRAQISHYGLVRCGVDELRYWLEQISAKLDAGLERIEITTHGKRQMVLWQGWPPIARAGAVSYAVPPRLPSKSGKATRRRRRTAVGIQTKLSFAERSGRS